MFDFVIIPVSFLFFNKLSNYLVPFRVLYLLLGAGFLAGGGVGGPALRFSCFLRVASLCGVILLILVWGRDVPVLSDPSGLCPMLVFW